MQDMLAHLEKLRVQVAECEIIRDLATDQTKRELFTKLAEHYKVLAAEVQRAIKERQARDSESALVVARYISPALRRSGAFLCAPPFSPRPSSSVWHRPALGCACLRSTVRAGRRCSRTEPAALQW